MFDIFSWQHLGIMLIVALVVVGPKDLPRLMHKAGKWAAKARNMAGEFRRSFDEMARQAELDELRKEIDTLRKNNPVTGMVNSVTDVNNELTREVGGAMDSVAMPQTASPIPEASEPRTGEFKVTEVAAPAHASPVPGTTGHPQ